MLRVKHRPVPCSRRGKTLLGVPTQFDYKTTPFWPCATPLRNSLAFGACQGAGDGCRVLRDLLYCVAVLSRRDPRTHDSLPDANDCLIIGLNNAIGKVRETRPRGRTVLADVLHPVVNDTPCRLVFSRDVGGRQSSRPREPARTVSAGGALRDNR